MTMRFFEYLQDDYGAAASDGVSAARGIDLASMAKSRINQKIVADGPKFKAACPTMVKRAMFTNANMARVETQVSPTLSDMASDLRRMKSKLSQLNDLLYEEAPAIGPLQELAALIESWPTWYKSIPVAGSTLKLVRQFVTLMGGYKTATGTAADAISSINDKIDYLNSVRGALRARVNRTGIDTDCNATSDKPMVEHVCTDLGINYRRMMKDRVRGVHASWDEPCNTFYYKDPGGIARKFKHPPSFALNYAPMSSYFFLHGTGLELRYANLCKLGECGRGPTKSLYGEGAVASSVNSIEGFLGTGTGKGTEWGRAAAEIEDDIKIYKAAIEQAMDQLAAIPKILKDFWFRETVIQIIIAAAGTHAAALAATVSVPVWGAITAVVGEITAQGVAHWTWKQMVKKVTAHVKKVRKNKNAILKKANTYWARATQRWIDDSVTFNNLRVSGGALAYAQRGIVNFEKALPKRSLCNPIYPTRKAGTWAKLAGYPDVTQWSVACPVVDPTVAAPRTRRMPAPIHRPGTPEDEGAPPGGPGERIAGPERESDMGAYGRYGALTAEPTTILGMKPWQAVLLAAGAYWLWTERK